MKEFIQLNKFTDATAKYLIENGFTETLKLMLKLYNDIEYLRPMCNVILLNKNLWALNINDIKNESLINDMLKGYK